MADDNSTPDKSNETTTGECWYDCERTGVAPECRIHSKDNTKK